ncbi:MAG: hypothetical protein JWN49_687 [Parcubacteria group bacterium]|nr:hypothetical protein [Parcubacteria group bacterium]
MNLSEAEFDEFISPSDAATAMMRMPPSERLPKFREHPCPTSADADLPEEAKDALRSIGQK